MCVGAVLPQMLLFVGNQQAQQNEMEETLRYYRIARFFSLAFLENSLALTGWREKAEMARREKKWQDDVFLGEESPRLNSMCQLKITHSHICTSSHQPFRREDFTWCLVILF